MFPTGPVAALEIALSKGELPKRCIFYGDSGCGKTTVARLLSACLLGAEKEELKNLVVYGRYAGEEFREINVSAQNKTDDARDLAVEIINCQGSFSDKPYIFLLDEAQRYTPDAQDALLSVLNVDLPNVYIFVTTTEIHKLKDTFQRRFTQHRFGLLTIDSADRYIALLMKRNGIADIDKETRKRIIQAANGSPGFIDSYLQSFVVSGIIPQEKDVIQGRAAALYDAFREAVEAARARDKEGKLTGKEAGPIKFMFQEMENLKGTVGSFEATRINLLSYIHYQMRERLAKSLSFDTMDREIFLTYLEILNPFLVDNSLGRYEMTARLLKMIERRVEIAKKYEGDQHG